MERHAIQERVGGNYARGSMFVCVFNGRYKLWWNITSLFMCVCQHMWVERCASEELFLFNRVGGIFVCVYLYIGEFVSSARECQRREGGRGGASEDLETHMWFSQLAVSDAFYAFVFFFMTTWSRFAPADYNLPVVTSHLNPQLFCVPHCSFSSMGDSLLQGYK